MKDWYVLWVKYGKERIVKKMLERDLDVEVRIEGDVSGYVSVYMVDTLELEYKIRNYPFVINFIGYDSKNKKLNPIR